jgi:hypothetical protein
MAGVLEYGFVSREGGTRHNRCANDGEKVIGMNLDFDPLAAGCDNVQHRVASVHIVLQLGHVFLGGCLFREIPG